MNLATKSNDDMSGSAFVVPFATSVVRYFNLFDMLIACVTKSLGSHTELSSRLQHGTKPDDDAKHYAAVMALHAEVAVLDAKGATEDIKKDRQEDDGCNAFPEELQSLMLDVVEAYAAAIQQVGRAEVLAHEAIEAWAMQQPIQTLYDHMSIRLPFELCFDWVIFYPDVI